PKSLLDLPIELPSLEIQKRIATEEKLKELIEQKRARQRELLSELEKSVFHQMFDLENLPKKPLGQIIRSLDGGKNLIAEDNDEKSAYRVLKISAVTNESFTTHETKPLPRGYIPPTAHFIKEGDLLISRANTKEMVGSVALVQNSVAN
ncbi:hypothetical protein GWI34_43160, partial [Actinomadura sp. DSM 109109]|nr:hypothetical protein [Actinomadura lepetitiana]